MPAVAGFVAADWSIDRDVTPSLISYIGDDHIGTDPSYATVLEFHRGISDMADDATSTGDDEHDITDPDATDKSTDNIITLSADYNLNAAAQEHLYDGSITFLYDNKEWHGIVNFGNAVTIQIIQNGAVLADDWWNNDPFSEGYGLNGSAAEGISHRFMLETIDNTGTDVDGRRLIGTSRTFNNTYSEFSISQTARGNNVLALSEKDDIFNNSTAANVSGWVITNTEGWQELDIDGTGAAGQAFYSQWDDSVGTGTGRAGTVNDIYEYIKWATRDGSATTLYGLNGELFRGITHEINVQAGTQSATDFSTVEPLSWGSGATAGTGQLLAVDDVNAADKMYIQLLTGVVPDNSMVITGGTSTATITTDAAGAVVARTPVPIPFLGASTGTNVIGGYGVGFLPASLGSSDQAFDLTNSQRIPPNNVTFTLSNLDATASNEDRILVTNNLAGDIDYAQLGLNSTLTTDVGTGTIVSDTVIPGDTPTSGYIRVLDNNGRYRRISYSSWSGSTFTINEGLGGEADFSTVNATAGNNMFVAYMDRIASSTSETFTGVNLNRTLFIRVRNAGNTPIKPFSGTASVTNADAEVSITRISDA